MSQNILITGGAGYIGSILTKKLVDKGFNVKVYDKFLFGHKPLSKYRKVIKIYRGDIRTPPNNIFENIDALIHLAALSNDPTAEFNPKANYEINTIATNNLAKKAKQAGIKKFIFASSCSIYHQNLKEKARMRYEKTKVKPRSAYSLSKYHAENEVKKLSDKNFCTIILRKGTVAGYSPRMRYDLVVNSMVKNALKNGRMVVYCKGVQWRPLIDIEDVADAYICAIKAPKNKVNGEIFNISQDNYLIKDLALLIQKRLLDKHSIKTDIVFEQDDKKDRSYKVSNLKAKRLLKFTPKKSMDETVSKLVDRIQKGKHADFGNPRYYNIEWMRSIFEKEGLTS